MAWHGVAPDKASEKTGQPTAVARDHLLQINLAMRLGNNTDYLVYGRELGALNGRIPSLTIEPVIIPYHQNGEMVFVCDIVRVWSTLHIFSGALGRQPSEPGNPLAEQSQHLQL